jgi:co-chaperonin GroES (HSP10)
MIRPIPGTVLVADLPEEEKAGLILPPGVGGRPDVGAVVAVGEGFEITLEPGDKVFYRKGHAEEVEDIKVVREGCIVAYDDGAES